MTTNTPTAFTNLHSETKSTSSVTSKLIDVEIEIKHEQKVLIEHPTSAVKFRYPTNGLYGLL
jgi:hypothetical protein